MTGVTGGQALDRVLHGRPGPRSVMVDHGTGFQSRAVEDWAYRRSVLLDFIRPGKHVENVFIEAFNGRCAMNASVYLHRRRADHDRSVANRL